MAKANEKWVRVTYPAPIGRRVTAKERAARKRLEASIEQAMEEFHQEGDGILHLEMYPTD